MPSTAIGCACTFWPPRSRYLGNGSVPIRAYLLLSLERRSATQPRADAVQPRLRCIRAPDGTEGLRRGLHCLFRVQGNPHPISGPSSKTILLSFGGSSAHATRLAAPNL